MDFSFKDKSKRNLLHWACYLGQLEAVRFILKTFTNININETEESDYTPLDLAIINGYILYISNKKISY